MEGLRSWEYLVAYEYDGCVAIHPPYRGCPLLTCGSEKTRI